MSHLVETDPQKSAPKRFFRVSKSKQCPRHEFGGLELVMEKGVEGSRPGFVGLGAVTTPRFGDDRELRGATWLVGRFERVRGRRPLDGRWRGGALVVEIRRGDVRVRPGFDAGVGVRHFCTASGWGVRSVHDEF